MSFTMVRWFDSKTPNHTWMLTVPVKATPGGFALDTDRGPLLIEPTKVFPTAAMAVTDALIQLTIESALHWRSRYGESTKR